MQTTHGAYLCFLVSRESVDVIPVQITRTLSGSSASSMLSNNARASEYNVASTSSSTWSPHGFILKHQMVLPADAAFVRSVGVLTRYSGDFDESEDVSKRAAWIGGGPVVVDGGGTNGSGSVWDG